MKVTTSKTEKRVMYDMGKFRHIVTYKADDTTPSDAKVEELEDLVIKLIAKDVTSEPIGTLRFVESQIMADNMIVCNRFDTIVNDLKSIISGIEKGTPVEEKPFPVVQDAQHLPNETDELTEV